MSLSLSLSLSLSIYIYIYIYILGEYITSSSALCLAGRRVAMESRRAGGRRELGSYLCQLVPLVAQRHSTHHPTSFRQRFMEASGSFRNSGKLNTCYKLPARLPETFRDLPELQRKDKITKQASGKLPGTFRDLPELQRK